MDKYEYNLKLEEIDKLVDQGDYEDAANLADTIDWRRVRNVRTLCLISEIYEAAGKLEKSKDMLERAYRRSPVGRNVLYRLVEVTTALGQYDEALEYYAEYVQTAPHDNNRFILKYMIYRGRGSSVEELIAILEEYLGQEYTERWAYELAILYQEAGQIQKCMAACDDLVLWFHSGRYVKKALELKKRYAVLTPKQQQIYEVCLQEEAQNDYFDEPEDEGTVVRSREEALESPGRSSRRQDTAPSGRNAMRLDRADDEVIAENIIAQTEKEIAGEITARMETPSHGRSTDIPSGGRAYSSDGSGRSGDAENTSHGNDTQAEKDSETDAQQERVSAGAKGSEPGLFAKVFRKGQENRRSAKMARKEQEAAEKAARGEAGTSSAKRASGEEKGPLTDESQESGVLTAAADPLLEAESFTAAEPAESSEYDDLQVELAKSVRKVISGVARKPELNEDDVPAAVEDRLHSIQEISRRREPEPTAGRLSIDDILLSMGEKGKQAAAEARARAEAAAVADAENTQEPDTGALPDVETREDGAYAQTYAEPEKSAADARVKGSEADTEAAIEAEEGTEKTRMDAEAREPAAAVRAEAGTEKPEATIRAEAGTEKPAATIRADAETENPAATIRADEDLEIKTRQSNEGAVRSITEAAARQLTEEQLEALRYSDNPEKFLKNRNSLPTYSSDAEKSAQPDLQQGVPAAGEDRVHLAGAKDFGATRKINTKEELIEAARKELMATKTIRIPTEEVARAYEDQTPGMSEEEAPLFSAFSDQTENVQPVEENTERPVSEEKMPPQFEQLQNEPFMEEPAEQPDDVGEEPDEDGYFDDPMTIEPHLRGLFRGFTEIDGLEDQIANAILQAMAKGEDRTSRNGNILIFGAHGSGKTTLGTNIAKAIAQKKGRQTVKMARIYAVDLNRRDIASTIAKIAGGTLIIEEAGDLEDNTVEQLTTAMEFRTDGLIVILEDEQRYVHDLLMRHPRFTMKFTAQIYLPVYTADELLMFASQHARDMDYSISEDGAEAIRQKVAEKSSTETPMSVGDIVELTDQAIRHSNKFMRKMSMGKKRYDENDYVLLFAKDFK